MFLKIWKNFSNRFFNFHRISNCDDLNFYYSKFFEKLTQQCLKIFLPLISFVYLFPLFTCRLIFYPSINDIRLSIDIVFICFLLILCLFTWLDIRRRKFWKFLRLLVATTLIFPLILTFQTEQFHLLFALISILLTYSSFTFTFGKSLLIGSIISSLHIFLYIRQRKIIQWNDVELISICFYHLISQLMGIHCYVTVIQHIRRHFYHYKTILFDKNRANVDCKKMKTIINYCQQTATTDFINYVE